jgi:hypothetical protein
MLEAVLMHTQPMTVGIAGQQIEIDRHWRVFYRSTRLAKPAGVHTAQPGDQIRFVPASTDSALLVAPRSRGSQTLPRDLANPRTARADLPRLLDAE